MKEKIENLLQQMTLAEKVSMAAGSTMWNSTGVERLGIPAVKVTDGPNGARGGHLFGGVSAACFPVGIALASTWNTDLVEQIGQALGQEAKTKGAHILLAPTVNIHRSPLNGRNFECYSEDPYLTARLAVAYINGVQSQNVGACIKHFVCNDSEFERMSISSEVAERPLREIYLLPFETAVKEAKPWSVMSSYNRINGTYACDNVYLLTDILKNEWGFEGIVMSDWFGTKSTVEAANAGLDLEMPGPPQWMGDKLLQAVKEGRVSEAVIDDKVRRLLRIVFKSGVFDDPAERPEQAVDSPEHRRLIRQAAGEAMVLLKNDRNVLPLDPNKIKTLAIIGPNVKGAPIMGGGSARVKPHHIVTAFEGITQRAGDTIELAYELGCPHHKLLPVLNSSWLTALTAATSGLQMEYFNSLDLSGEVVATAVADTAEIVWFGDLAQGVDPEKFSARLTANFTAPESGRYTFSLVSVGLSRLYLDGQELIDNWSEQFPGESFFGMGSREMKAEVELQAGRVYALKIEYSREKASMLAGLRVGCLLPIPEDAIKRAATLAAGADVALLFVGTTDEWESEGFDRPGMDLPGEQNLLVEKVAAANPNTVVVLNTGSPHAMPWLDKVAGVVQAWFPGQEAGHALADVLFGDVNPSGKLSQTFPKRLADNPAFINYPGENGRVYYGEGLFVGYRYYEKKMIEPLFPFGYGLSYTTFEYNNLALNAKEYAYGDTIQVSVAVTNTGRREGKEVVQLYVRDVRSSLARPEKELKAFKKVALKPGETQTVAFTLDGRALSFYDPEKQGWVAEAGEFEILVGSSSQDIRARATFFLQTSGLVSDVEGNSAKLGVKNTLKELLANAAAKAILEKHFGEMMRSPQLAVGMDFSLEQIAGFVPDVLTPDKLRQLDEELGTL
ncbi:MAG: glycoside hydrolase family 3 C-terminal domain-containing protein [Anaerolineae bacterium]|nr:glycoside hydrolase family 3 C-terminal domain-containing protein [Anaerolineae bacterium]